MKMNCYEPAFHHIYVEERALARPKTQKILTHFTKSEVVLIHHYKDVFNRAAQTPALQSRARSLILADESDPRVYAGAPVCQDFGNKAFYYTSTVMNCVYDCDYCYLKGMYGSGDLVVFVDQSATFAAVDKLLEKSPVYLCISYDTDLAAIEPFTGFIKEWYAFAADRPELTLEIRTKCADQKLLQDLPPLKNVIWAFTLSPDKVAERFENKAPGLSERLAMVRTAMEQGHPVRLCFDPMLRFPGWREAYQQLAGQVKQLPEDKVRDISIGTFRISAQYLGQMRKNYPGNACAQYPYTVSQAVAGYGARAKEMTQLLVDALTTDWTVREKLFLWEEQEPEQGQ